MTCLGAFQPREATFFLEDEGVSCSPVRPDLWIVMCCGWVSVQLHPPSNRSTLGDLFIFKSYKSLARFVGGLLQCRWFTFTPY